MYFLKKIFIGIVFFIIPSITFAGNVNFVDLPNITLQGVTGGVQAVVSGQINVDNVPWEEYSLGVKVYQGSTTPTQDQINDGTSWNDISNTNSAPISSFNSTAQFILNPGSTYQFVFRLITESPHVGQTVIVPVVTPGSPNTNGTSSDPLCQDCPLIVSSPIDDQVFDAEGWPQGVLENTLEVDDINSFVVGLLNALLKIGIPILAVFLVYSGLKLVMAQGNEKELADAKKNLLWVIIGGAVLLGSWTIVKILKGTFDEIDLVFINSLVNFIV